MQRILPIFFTALVIFAFFLAIFKTPVYAEAAEPTAVPTTPAGQWQEDDEVSFVGKTASRSGDFLDWTLQNYSWLCVTKLSANQCDNTNNPLIPFWVIIRNIVYAIIALFVLATAFILIVTRGQNITIMRFIPRFVFIILLITFSFALVQFIYQVGDVIQDFFLKVNNTYITTKDLLFIGFDYVNFHGYRLRGPDYDESAFISLLLVRLTAITYYVMTGILLIRKIILWFFIIISPIFPLLLFYRPIRNTAKIWVGEFFRWLLYAPLFAIFLHGLVVVWQRGIPLAFNFDGAKAGEVVYPTAVNILLGGPGQAIGLTNSVNLRDTFAQYVVALLMLWIVILLPFLLLKIFLDYLNTLSFGANLNWRQLVTRSGTFLPGPKGTPPSTPPPAPGLPQPAGTGRTLPFYASKGAAVTPIQVRTGAARDQSSIRESTDVLVLANLTIPKMRDIARYETSMLSKDTAVKSEASKVNNSLKQIANPSTAIISSEREKFSSVRQKLIEQKQKGNPVASSVLAASQITSSSVTQVKQQTAAAAAGQTIKAISSPQSVTAPAQQTKVSSLRDQLVKEKDKGNQLASDILETSKQLSSKDITEDQKASLEKKMIDKLLEEDKKGNSLATSILKSSEEEKPKQQVVLPQVNHVQQVSLEDYEQVRNLWVENYQKIEPPQDLSGNQLERREWIKSDIDKIAEAVYLLSSVDADKVNNGMNMVSNILPFLLVGGFSKTEVIAYLKAKMEAGKSVLSNLSQKEEEEETLLDATKKTKTEEAKMSLEQKAEESLDENPAFKEPASGAKDIEEKDKPKL